MYAVNLLYAKMCNNSYLAYFFLSKNPLTHACVVITWPFSVTGHASSRSVFDINSLSLCKLSMESAAFEANFDLFPSFTTSTGTCFVIL